MKIVGFYSQLTKKVYGNKGARTVAEKAYMKRKEKQRAAKMAKLADQIESTLNGCIKTYDWRK